MKYQRITEIIDAEEYKVGMEDGFGYHCNWYETSTTADCYLDKQRNHCAEECGGEQLSKTAYINDAVIKLFVGPGCFIVTDEYGGRSVYTADVFHMTFKEVEE
jgi:hypothetical protein